MSLGLGRASGKSEGNMESGLSARLGKGGEGVSGLEAARSILKMVWQVASVGTWIQE